MFVKVGQEKKNQSLDMLKSEKEHVKELSDSLWSYIDDYGCSNGVPLDLETSQDYQDKFAHTSRKSWSIPLFLDTHVDLGDMHGTPNVLAKDMHV